MAEVLVIEFTAPDAVDIYRRVNRHADRAWVPGRTR